MEQHLLQMVSGDLKIKDCCVHGSLMDVLVFLESWRPLGSFRLLWIHVKCLSRNDSGVLCISEQVNIHGMLHMEVLGSGHVCGDGHVLERSPWTPVTEDLCPFLCSWWAVQKGDVCLSQRGMGRMGDLAPWLTVLGRAQPLWLQLGKLLLRGGQCMEGQRSAARGLKLQCARRRQLWAQPLPSFLGVVVHILELCHHCQRCLGAAAAPGSAGAGLSVLLISATGSRFFALKTFGWCLAFCAR